MTIEPITDIIERLEWNANSEEDRFSRKTCAEAAIEIKRLRTEINGYKHDTRRLLEGENYLLAEIKRLQDEIERLLRELTLLHANRGSGLGSGL